MAPQIQDLKPQTLIPDLGVEGAGYVLVWESDNLGFGVEGLAGTRLKEIIQPVYIKSPNPKYSKLEFPGESEARGVDFQEGFRV